MGFGSLFQRELQICNSPALPLPTTRLGTTIFPQRQLAPPALHPRLFGLTSPLSQHRWCPCPCIYFSCERIRAALLTQNGNADSASSTCGWGGLRQSCSCCRYHSPPIKPRVSASKSVSCLLHDQPFLPFASIQCLKADLISFSQKSPKKRNENKKYNIRSVAPGALSPPVHHPGLHLSVHVSCPDSHTINSFTQTKFLVD